MTGRYFLYLIGSAAGPIKIGVSSDVNRRLTQVQTGNATAQEVFATFRFANRREAEAMEALLHRTFGAWRVRGEWFGGEPHKLVEEVIKAIGEAGGPRPARNIGRREFSRRSPGAAKENDITVARIEHALEIVAKVMITHPLGVKAVPIFQRLERELGDARSREAAFERARLIASRPLATASSQVKPSE